MYGLAFSILYTYIVDKETGANAERNRVRSRGVGIQFNTTKLRGLFCFVMSGSHS